MIDLYTKELVICGIVRDAEKGLRVNFPVINDLVRFFHNYTIIIYENDSKDATKDILKKWSDKDNKHVHVFMENLNQQKPTPKSNIVSCNPFYSRKRISKMVFLRNQYMERLERMNIVADYLIIVDLDVAKLNLSAILNSFNYEKEWDAVTANGYSLGPNLKRRYHDTYALTEYGDEKNPQTEAKIKKLAEKYGSLCETDDWVRVYSAFGGLAIYKYEAIKGLRYQLLDNDDERVEVRCEHFSICKQMAERGNDKIYINPAMQLKYQSLSMKLIYNTVKRKLGL